MTRKYPLNEQVFLDETETSYYLLGVMMTDGCIDLHGRHRKFIITSKDIDWLELIRDVISPTRPIHKSKNCFRLEANSKLVTDWLMSYGCLPTKSLSLSIAKKIPPAYIPHFLRGVIDGDGSVSLFTYSKKKNGRTYRYKNSTVYICSGSKTFITQIAALIDSCQQNINYSMVEIKRPASEINGWPLPANTYWRIQFTSKNCIKMLDFCYQSNELAMPRKAALAREAEAFLVEKSGN